MVAVTELAMEGVRPLVSVVDDDVSVRESLPALLQSFGLDSIAFASAEEFLGSGALATTSCLLLDVVMTGMSGPDLQCELLRRDSPVPVVFITANHDENLRSRLLAQGASDCLFKPFFDDTLEKAVLRALADRSG
ncbi:response regulator transcription factor [Rhizobium grahamii]|uniref:Response regulator receiver protein n=1 Tax=Rhizobium grahamii CCGE 502 TaxID=990285 RepID=S3HL65_9HYPH|nr:response regulator receiver protein [Rhizobium grahamii CCGE 502]